MTGDDQDRAGLPLRKRDQLTLSLTNLIDEYATTDSPYSGVAINLALAALGIVAYWQLSTPVAYLGLAWTALNLAGIITWGIEQ